ncbi:hypothetical protein BJY59DRAFT_698146 [Rhodotorula toruloides]
MTYENDGWSVLETTEGVRRLYASGITRACTSHGFTAWTRRGDSAFEGAFMLERTALDEIIWRARMGSSPLSGRLEDSSISRIPLRKRRFIEAVHPRERARLWASVDPRPLSAAFPARSAPGSLLVREENAGSHLRHNLLSSRLRKRADLPHGLTG